MAVQDCLHLGAALSQATSSKDGVTHRRTWLLRGFGLTGFMLIGVCAWVMFPHPSRTQSPSGSKMFFDHKISAFAFHAPMPRLRLSKREGLEAHFAVMDPPKQKMAIDVEAVRKNTPVMQIDSDRSEDIPPEPKPPGPFSLLTMRMLQQAVSTLGTRFGPPLAVQVGNGVKIRPAPGKGLGVFASRDIEAGAYLGRYTGTLLTTDEAFNRWRNGQTSADYFAFLYPLGSPMVIDAEDPNTSGWPRFINHSDGRANCVNAELRQPLLGPNSPRLPYGLYVQAMRDIKAGEELLLNYGDEYWASRGIARDSLIP